MIGAILSNVCQNLYQAWTFGNLSYEEPEKWERRTVEIVALDKSLSTQSISYYDRFCYVCLRIRDIVLNSISFYRNNIIEVAYQQLYLQKGKYKSICQVPTLDKNYVFITDPNVMQEVLRHERNETDDNGFFLGGIPTVNSIKILGDNLLSYPGKKHAEVRNVLMPHFTRITDFLPSLEEIVEKTINGWSVNMDDESFNFSQTLPATVIETVSRCFLDYDGPFDEISKNIDLLLQHGLKSSRNRHEDISYTHAHEFIDACAKSAAERRDVVPTLKDISEQELLTFIKFMFFAGQDTTAALIEYIVSILGKPQYKSWQNTLREKWTQTGGSLVQFISESKELEWVVKEALRLHPASFEQTRYVKKDLLIDGRYIVPKGAEIHLLHLYSQRDSRRWQEDAEVFNPLRHADHQIMYPFSSGRTACVGRQLAVALVKMYVMKLISKMEWSTTNEVEKLECNVVLKISPPPKIAFSNLHIEDRNISA